MTGEVKHYPLEKFERTIQINLISTFRCIARSAAGMLSLPVLDDPHGPGRARRDCQYGVGCRAGRPDGTGRLQRVEGGRSRHDAADLAPAKCVGLPPGLQHSDIF